MDLLGKIFSIKIITKTEYKTVYIIQQNNDLNRIFADFFLCFRRLICFCFSIAICYHFNLFLSNFRLNLQCKHRHFSRRSGIKISEKFLNILEGYQNIRNLKNYRKYQNLRKNASISMGENCLVYLEK